MKPSILILHASGTNRDGEAARACELAGAVLRRSSTSTSNRRAGERTLSNYQMLLLPGGFSYGDALEARAWPARSASLFPRAATRLCGKRQARAGHLQRLSDAGQGGRAARRIVLPAATTAQAAKSPAAAPP